MIHFLFSLLVQFTHCVFHRHRPITVVDKRGRIIHVACGCGRVFYREIRP